MDVCCNFIKISLGPDDSEQSKIDKILTMNLALGEMIPCLSLRSNMPFALKARYPVLAGLEAWELLLMSKRNQPCCVEVISVEPHSKDLLTHIITVSWGPTATVIRVSVHQGSQGRSIWARIDVVDVGVHGCCRREGEMRG